MDRRDSMMAEPTLGELPLVLRSSPMRNSVMLLVCLAFVATGVLMARDGHGMGYFCAAFFGLGAVVFAVNLHPRAGYLRLETESFTVCSLFRTHTVLWSDVETFGVMKIRHNKMVAWNFAPTYEGKAGVRKLNRALAGFDAGMAGSYGGLTTQALAEMMEGLRAEAMRKPESGVRFGIRERI
jgi:hypothetical protein